jgi:excisionase family DNA binding protein
MGASEAMNDEDTVDLAEAAAFLKMSQESLRRKAKAGDIPGAKPGKRWCFIKSDLTAYVRSHYSTTSEAALPRGPTRAAPAKTPDLFGPMRHGDVDPEYRRLLGLDHPPKSRIRRRSK